MNIRTSRVSGSRTHKAVWFCHELFRRHAAKLADAMAKRPARKL